jgi:hypothetical protein
MLPFLCAAVLACGCTYPTLVLLDGGIDGSATDAAAADAASADAASADATSADATSADATSADATSADAAALAAVRMPAAAPAMVGPLVAPVAFGAAAAPKKTLQHTEIAGQNSTSQQREGQFLEAVRTM